jgi:SynChlorMet cassette radical SAM/SPASM protein ScmF
MTPEQIQLPPGVPPLSTYYVYMTGGCNLACRHCWLSPIYQPNGTTGGHLDFDLFALAIEEGIPLGLRSIKLTGGEPLLHPEFVRMVDYLTAKGLGLNIETNGTLMTAELARHLKDHSTLGSSTISVSIDGATAASHDSFRGVKGAFERACQGVRYLSEVGFYPQIIMSLHAGNVDEIEAVVRMAEQLGAGSVKFNLIQASGRGEMMVERNQTLDIQRLLEVGRWVERDLQKSTQVSLFYSWPMAFQTLKRLQDGNAGICGIKNILGILPDGQFAMCGIGEEIPELCYGRLGKTPLADVWANNPLLIEMRRKLPAELEGVCEQCFFKQRCLASCVAQNYRAAGSLTADFWFCHDAYLAGLFPTTRLVNTPVIK